MERDGPKSHTRTERGSLVDGAATHRPANATGIMPASSGTNVPLAREDRKLRGCARVSSRLQKSTGQAEVSRSAPRRQRGACTGTWPPEAPTGALRGEKVREVGRAVAKLRDRTRREPGAREGVAGQAFLVDGRYLRSSIRCTTFTRVPANDARRLVWKATACERGAREKGATGILEARSQKRGPPKRIALNVKQAISSMQQRRKPMTALGTYEARVLVHSCELAEVGPTHRASRGRKGRKVNRRREAGRRALRRTS